MNSLSGRNSLSSSPFEDNSAKMGETARAMIITILRVLMVLILCGWISIWLLKPTDLWTRIWRKAEDHARNTIFGYYGLNYAVYTVPIIAVSIIGLVYLRYNSIPMRRRRTRSAITATALSNPLILRGLLGIVSAAELLVICIFIVFLLWTFYIRISKDFKNLMPIKSLKLNIWQLKCSRVATRFGLLAEACLALLLFPVLRVMPLFRVIGIQFESSIRYHVWIGTAMILFATLHGVGTLFVWGVSHNIQEEIWKWQKSGRIYLAAEVGLLAGLVIWVTSLPVIRRNRFEIFYYTHHLFIIFLLFFLFHAGDRHFYSVFPGIFLFCLDKMLRIIQSRPETCILSAKVFPGKAMELTIPKDPRLRYAPTSIVFVKIPRISKLQWHPFSITSSSAAVEETITIIAKCEGSWSNDLHLMLSEELRLDAENTKYLPIYVEGPYGPPSVNFLRYDSLLMIAGGIGITPFLSIIQEIGSCKSTGNLRFPERIQLIFITKMSRDICLLNSISHLLWKRAARKHNLKLKVYVTQEKQSNTNPRSIFQDSISLIQTLHFNSKPTQHSAYGPGTLLETVAIAVIASILFFVFLLSFNHIFVPQDKKLAVKPKLKEKGLGAKEKTASSVIDLILIASFLLSIIGSSVVAIFLRWRRLKKEVLPASPKKSSNTDHFELSPGGATADDLEEHEIHFGGRPNFQDIFSMFQGETGGSDVGVLVCGPESMKESVASKCREIRPGLGAKKRPKFTFHSLNFTL